MRLGRSFLAMEAGGASELIHEQIQGNNDNLKVVLRE